PNLVVFIAAWLIVGLGMGAGLYDAAFSTLGRLYGREARSAITTLTLFGGFASTVCWPLSAFLLSSVGWRGTCLAYAAIQLCLSLPLYLFLVPWAPRHEATPAAGGQAAAATRAERPLALVMLLAITLSLASTISSL